MATLIGCQQQEDTSYNPVTITNFSSQDPSIMATGKKPDHMSHKKWKAYLKKMKRKKKRSEMAKEREGNQPVVEEVPTDSEEERQREQEEEERSLRQNLLWMQREREAQAAFTAKKEWEENERRRKEEVERKIKEEWAERERKEKEEQEAKEKKETEKREKQVILIKGLISAYPETQCFPHFQLYRITISQSGFCNPYQFRLNSF
ncbi:hypothetical protein EGW08_001809, partial [Elysia chlorotica]